jgi:dihydroneopterin aldolase
MVIAVSITGAFYPRPIMSRRMTRSTPEPKDHIFIRDFRLQTLIGFHRRERIVPQTIRLDLEIGIADAAVFTSDKVADCIDYDKVTARIKELASQHVNLVETLAERVARLVLEEFGAAWVKVSIAKLGILKDVALVGVTVERRRS